MHRSLSLAAVVLSAASASCLSNFEVHEGSKEVEGVPFFVKRPQYTRTTEYEVRWLEVSLTLRKDDKDKQAVSLTKRVPTSGRRAVDELARTVKGEAAAARGAATERLSFLMNLMDPDGTADPERLEFYGLRADEARELTDLDDPVERFTRGAWATVPYATSLQDTAWDRIRALFDALPAIPESEFRAELADPASARLPKACSGNRLAYTPVIDYSKPHYYNVKTPLFAKVDANVELNADLLLTKATANADLTDVAESVTALIPFKEVLEEALLDAAAVAPMLMTEDVQPLTVPRGPGVVGLTIAETGIRYKLSKSAETGAELAAPVAFDLSGRTDFTQEPLVPPKPKAPKEDPKTTKTSFQLSGDVKMPKN